MTKLTEKKTFYDTLTHVSGSLDGFGLMPAFDSAANIWRRRLSSVWKYRGRPFLQQQQQQQQKRKRGDEKQQQQQQQSFVIYVELQGRPFLQQQHQQQQKHNGRASTSLYSQCMHTSQHLVEGLSPA
jgi:hypothetical protein